MKTDLNKYKYFFNEMGIDYQVITHEHQIELRVDDKHIFHGYGNQLSVCFDLEEKFVEFEAWGE